MAVPKKRTGKSAQAKRRANWKATTPATTTCKQCGSVVLAHTVCPECGTYKGKKVSIKAVAAPVVEETAKKTEEVSEVKETKKTASKSKKAVEEKATEAEVSEEKKEEKPKRSTKSKKADTEAE